MGKPEGAIERHLRDQAAARGWLALKFTAPGTRGVPDRVLITPAGTMFVELKAPGAKPRREQLAMHRRMRRAGGQVVVIDSKPDVDTLLDAIAAQIPQEDTSADPR